jgi:cell wall-associated NlpC family hydrolase
MLRVLAIAVVVVALGVGGLALAASGREHRPATPARAKKQAESKLPPLPDMRPKVVEPVAGNGGAAPAESDPGLTEVGPKPKGPASAGAVRHGATVTADVTKARALGNGVAVPPLDAPDEVKQIIEAGNVIARTPYLWGGGHGKWLDKGYDCSGSVSFALAAAGLLNGPLASGPLMSWGEPGPGKWVTIYSSPGHVYMYVAGVRFDTSNSRVTGSRWSNTVRSNAGFVARHPAGL